LNAHGAVLMACGEANEVKYYIKTAVGTLDGPERTISTVVVTFETEKEMWDYYRKAHDPKREKRIEELERALTECRDIAYSIDFHPSGLNEGLIRIAEAVLNHEERKRDGQEERRGQGMQDV
jgi:hypothetical protein